ncbi:MAG: sigma-70 family RNA polymerase sigma factor [Anaerolineaceae bacterium]|nr:sigma-70 family RNA polymerase sigma factor [Anaerolineaceae bacterium]
MAIFPRDENQLIKKAIFGDKEAFGHLYDQYFMQIFKYLLIRSESREDAEDMTELVFIKAWKHLPNFGRKKKEHNFRAWIFRIAHNTLIDSYRTKKGSLSLESVSQNRSANPEPEKIILRNEQVERIHKAVNMLNEVMQQVIVSRFVSGLSHKEIAQSVGISESNARIIQYRTLRKLKALLEEENE